MNRLASVLSLALCLAPPASPQDLRIYHIDVEQAAATLFVAPGGKTLLVDSGKNGQGAKLKAVMDQAGVTQIDLSVCTHYHEDHFGGIDDLVDLGVTVAQAFDRGDKDLLSAEGVATWVRCQRIVGCGR
jgi:competence protein ComEC